MAGTTYIIDPPGPYAPPEELRAFLKRLDELDQDSIDVKLARERVEEYLRWQESRRDHESDSG